jgi:hypothetical protein
MRILSGGIIVALTLIVSFSASAQYRGGVVDVRPPVDLTVRGLDTLAPPPGGGAIDTTVRVAPAAQCDQACWRAYPNFSTCPQQCWHP